uniref:LytR/AlgR family response regulator transcription factor n=1 Tax=Alistipes sp. TaxID=1872444 RepID=UPI004056B766
MIKCIAIDDEPLALRQIKSYITKTPELELQELFHSPLAAQEWLKEHDTDLLFIDINMPELSGLDLVRSLKRRPLIIFTTAYAEYAVEGFRLDAADYLLKPFSLSDFQRSVAKVASLHELIRLAQERETTSTEEELSEALPEGKEYISIKADYRNTLIRTSEILYIESEGEYVRLHLADGSSIMTLFRLKNMEAALPSSSFLRVHRSFIVNLKQIASYAKGRIFLSENEYIPIGDNYRAAFMEYAEKHF